MNVQPWSMWSDDEIQILKAHYIDHGPNWEMWELLLPRRSSKSISRKACQLGISKPKESQRKTVVADERHRIKEVTSLPDPMERTVLRYMEGGMAPSQIDKKMGWRPGRAAYILSERWRRQNECE